MFLSYVFHSTVMNLMIYTKITYLCLNVSRYLEENILSNYQRHLMQDEGFSKTPPNLVPNLCHKTNYIINYSNLKLYLELGLSLTHVHPILSFDQSP